MTKTVMSVLRGKKDYQFICNIICKYKGQWVLTYTYQWPSIQVVPLGDKLDKLPTKENIINLETEPLENFEFGDTSFGYFNAKGGTTYITWKLSPPNGAGVFAPTPRMIGVNLPAMQDSNFLDMLNNVYPTSEEAYKVAHTTRGHMAFHRHFAFKRLSYMTMGLMYRDQLIGEGPINSTPEDIKVYPGFKYIERHLREVAGFKYVHSFAS